MKLKNDDQRARLSAYYRVPKQTRLRNEESISRRHRDRLPAVAIYSTTACFSTLQKFPPAPPGGANDEIAHYNRTPLPFPEKMRSIVRTARKHYLPNELKNVKYLVARYHVTVVARSGIKRCQSHRRKWTAAKREFDEQALGGSYCSSSRRWRLRSPGALKSSSRGFCAGARRINHEMLFTPKTKTVAMMNRIYKPKLQCRVTCYLSSKNARCFST